MSTSALSPLEQWGQSVQQQQPAPASSLSPLEQLGQSVQKQTTPSNGPSAEEQQFLNNNQDYKYLPADPKFPNRPEGIYPTGPGNDWRNDPSYAQSPVDLHLLKHSAQGAGEGAVAAGSPLLIGPAEAFASTAAGKALLDVVSKYGAKAASGIAAGAGLGIGHEAFHKAAKLLGLASEGKEK